MNDFTQLRRRNDVDRANDRRPDQTRGVSRYYGQIYDGGAIPVTVPKMYLTHPISLVCDESEGATPTITADASVSVPVLILGPNVPTVGKNVRAKLIDGLWIAQHGTTGRTPVVTYPTPNCACSVVPANLFLVSTCPYVNSCTLVYGSPPTPIDGVSYPNAWYSTASFTDPINDPPGFGSYYWRFLCSTPTFGFYAIARYYTDNTFYGTPQSNIQEVYSSWGGHVPSCNPFVLDLVAAGTSPYCATGHFQITE